MHKVQLLELLPCWAIGHVAVSFNAMLTVTPCSRLELKMLVSFPLFNALPRGLERTTISIVSSGFRSHHT